MQLNTNRNKYSTDKTHKLKFVTSRLIKCDLNNDNIDRQFKLRPIINCLT